MPVEKKSDASRDVAVLAHAYDGDTKDEDARSGDMDGVREQTGQIVKQALIEMGVTASPDQIAVLVTGFVGLASLATAEYRRAKALHGSGPDAVDRLYRKSGMRGHHEQH